MNNKILLLICIFFLSFLTHGYAEEFYSEGEDSNLVDRNPFKSWLPKVEEKIENRVKETKINTVETPTPIIAKKETKVEVSPPRLVINGLVWNTKQPQAIINERVVTIGDTIENSEVINIHKEGVDILFANKLFTIKMEQALTQSI
jgi:hypothetical protein